METALTFMSKDDIFQAIEQAVFKALQVKYHSDEPQLLTVEQVCEYYSISRNTLEKYQRSGSIKVYKLGRRNFYNKAEIDQFILNSRKNYD